MTDLPVLTVEEQRVLGALLEKEVTVPASYPMSVNAVRTACNQTSSREPVVDYDERLVHETLRGLKEKGLAGVTWEDRGKRTLKYVQSLVATLGLQDDERALLTVLLLRGAQPPGALKTRTERLHPFADRAEVEQVLARMAALDPPLVSELPRRVREQDNRWIHLLGPVEASADAAPTQEPDVDRESVLGDGGEVRDAKVRTSYGAVAASYAEALTGELADLPFERWLLDRVAAEPGPVVEVGCGPGHVTAYLASAGADATGVDLTPEMVEQARRRFPDGRYEVGDLRQLMRPTNAEGWGVVLAWYSLIHLAPSELPAALAALLRPLRPGGWLVVAGHVGHQVRNNSTWFEHEIDLDFVFHEPSELVARVREVGLTEVEWYHRGPLTERGETTERVYVIGRTPPRPV